MELVKGKIFPEEIWGIIFSTAVNELSEWKSIRHVCKLFNYYTHRYGKPKNPEFIYKMLIKHNDITMLDIFMKNVSPIDEKVVMRYFMTSPLSYASECGNMEIVKLLLNVATIQHGNDILSVAIRGASNNNRIEIVKLLLEKIRTPEYKNNEYDNMTFIFACTKGYTEIVKLLLNKDFVNMNERIEDCRQGKPTRYIECGSVALIRAAQNGYIDIVNLLLKLNGTPSDLYNKALIAAAKNGHKDIVKLLLRSDNSPDWILFNDKAIIKASEYGHYKIVKLLLIDGRAEPSADNNEAIIRAARNGKEKVVKLLMRNHNVDPSDRNNMAIHEALKSGHNTVVELLKADKRVYIEY